MKNFDEKIRDKLFDAEMPVSSGVWDSIEARLEIKDERPKYWFFLLLSLIVVPTLFFASYYNHEDLAHTDSDPVAFADFSNQGHNILEATTSEVVPKELIADMDQLNRHATLIPIAKSDKILNLGFQVVSTKESSLQKYESQKVSNFEKLPSNNYNTVVSGLNNHDEISFLDGLFSSGTQCPDFQGKLPGLYAYANLTSAYPIQFLSSDQFEMAGYIQSRSNTEYGLLSYSFDAGLGYDFFDNYFVEAGIMYDQINMKFLHKEVGVISNRTDIIINTEYNAEGDVISEVIDTIVVQEVGVREIAKTNKFTKIDIPVSLGYKYHINRKFDISLSAGVIFNLSTRSSGYMVDAVGKPFKYTNDNNEVFKSTVGLSYTAGLKLETQLNNDFYLNAGLNMKYYADRFNSDLNRVNQNYLSLGLSAGIRYRI